jgi:hypothetical protein
MSDGTRNLPSARKRLASDLIQFVKNRADNVPNYTLFLGAGGSVTSGVRTANQLVSEWRKEMYERYAPGSAPPYEPELAKAFLSREQSQWYSLQREYSSLFEKKFDLPPQRRMFVEREVDAKMPSLGYAYLVRLVQHNFLNTIFTTNFDDLLNEAFHQFSDIRPIVCAHDSAIASVTVTSKRPKIIKLHGDYLFDDLKSTARETESLEENMKRKFAEFSKDHGLIVVGYGACDRSIMDVLQRLLKHEEYFKNGIYWCIRDESEPSDELLRLLWRDRVYWVKVDGFDEFMAELYDSCCGAALPVDTSLVSDKPREMIGRFCSPGPLSESSSRRIRTDLTKLQTELDREALVQSVRDVTRNNEDDREGLELSDRDAIKLIAIRQLVEDGELDTAFARIQAELAQTTHETFQLDLLNLRLAIDQKRGDWNAAIETCNAKIKIDPNETGYLIARSSLERTFEAKANTIGEAIRIDQYAPAGYRARASLLARQMENDPSCDEQSITEQICLDFERSLRLNSAFSNPAWDAYLAFLSTNSTRVAKEEERTRHLLESADGIDPFSSTTFALHVDALGGGKGKEREKDAVLKRIREAIPNQSNRVRRNLELLLLRALRKFHRRDELLRTVTGFDADPKWLRYLPFVKLRARIMAENEGRFEDAICLLQGHPRYSKDASMVESAISLLCVVGRVEQGREQYELYKALFDFEYRDSVLAAVWEGERAFEEHLASIRRRKSRGMFPARFVSAETHELLKLGRYKEAEEVARQLLEPTSFPRQFDVVIINYEIAVLRQQRKVNKERLDRIIGRNPNDDLVCLCAEFLMDRRQEAAERIVKVVTNNRTLAHAIGGWAVFDTTANRQWLQGILKTRHLAAANDDSNQQEKLG